MKIKGRRIIKLILIVILIILIITFWLLKVRNNSNFEAELIQLKNNGNSQMMGYIIKTKNNKIIVIDGGTYDDTQNLLSKINEYTGKVDYWFITHPHKDHASCFIDIVENTNIEIGQVFVTLNEASWYEKYESKRQDEAKKLIEVINNSRIKENVIEVSLNQVIEIDNLKCEILGTKNPEITINAINNSSMIIKIITNKNSIIFLGDTGLESGNKLLKNQKDKLKANIVQMAHHGQSGVSEEVYKQINPSICMWPTPDWLWDNVSGQWKTEETKQWIRKLNIKLNIIEKDGDMKIEI